MEGTYKKGLTLNKISYRGRKATVVDDGVYTGRETDTRKNGSSEDTRKCTEGELVMRNRVTHGGTIGQWRRGFPGTPIPNAGNAGELVFAG